MPAPSRGWHPDYLSIGSSSGSKESNGDRQMMPELLNEASSAKATRQKPWKQPYDGLFLTRVHVDRAPALSPRQERFPLSSGDYRNPCACAPRVNCPMGTLPMIEHPVVPLIYVNTTAIQEVGATWHQFPKVKVHFQILQRHPIMVHLKCHITFKYTQKSVSILTVRELVCITEL